MRMISSRSQDIYKKVEVSSADTVIHHFFFDTYPREWSLGCSGKLPSIRKYRSPWSWPPLWSHPWSVVDDYIEPLETKVQIKNEKLFLIIGLLPNCTILELRQCKNDSIWLKDKSALNLPRFFTRLYGREKGRQFRNWIPYGPNGVALILSLL